MSKFHKRIIKKGVYGELSKIEEELQEAYDAEEQGQDLMLLIELSDMVGAIEGVAKKYGMNLEQLRNFATLRSYVAIEENKEEIQTENKENKKNSDVQYIHSLSGLASMLLNGEEIIESQLKQYWQFKHSYSMLDLAFTAKKVKFESNEETDEIDELIKEIKKLLIRKLD